MEETCGWCNQQAPYLHAVKITTLHDSNNYQVPVSHEMPLCDKCRQELEDYEHSWEIVSH